MNDTFGYLLDRLRKIDPDVVFEEHKTIPYALMLVPSEAKYLGDLLYCVETNRCAGILVEVVNYGALYQPKIMIEVAPNKLNWRQKLARWICK